MTQAPPSRLQRSRSIWNRALLALLGGLLSCQAGPSPVAPSEKAPAAREVEAPSWVFHPTDAELLLAHLETPRGELVVDQGGTRWLVQEDGPEPSPYGAPEALVGATKQSSGYAFVGKSGTVYLTESPLGDFHARRLPPELWVDTALAGGELLGVSVLGKLFRSRNWGETWSLAEASRFVTAIETDASGQALVLSVPEQWHVWDGSGLKTVEARPIGARDLWSHQGKLFVDSALGGFLLSPEGLVRHPLPQREAAWVLPPRPSADQILSGEVLAGPVNLGLRRGGPSRLGSGSGPSGIELLRGAFGAPLGAGRTLPVECAAPRLLRSGVWFAVVCELATAGANRRRFVWVKGRWEGSGPGQDELSPQPLRVDTQEASVEFAVSHRGTLALLGGCPESRQKEPCSAEGTAYVVRGGELVPAGLSLPEQGHALVFAPGTERLFAVVVRAKDRHILVLSKDVGADAPQVVLDLSQELDVLGSDQTLVHLLPGGDGLVGVSIVSSGRGAVATLGSAGQLLAFGALPAGASRVHGAGARFVALAADGGSFWESLNGGVTWLRARLPRRGCSGRDDCEPVVACSDAGCVFGSELTRVGWGMREAGAPSSLEVLIEQEAQTPELPGFRCRPASDVWQPLPHLTSFPSASDASLGTSDWAAVHANWQTGEVRFSRVDRGESALRVELGLAGLARPQRSALHISHQIEGAAALRYEVPVDPSSGGPLHQLEVVWDNRILGVRGQGRLQKPLAARRGDFRAGDGQIGEAFPGLISIAGSGVYLRPHRTSAEHDETYYFEGSSVEQLAAARFPPGVADLDDAEFVRVDGQHEPLLFSPSRAEAVFARGGPADATFFGARLLSLYPDDPRLVQGAGMAYLGSNIGFLSKFAHVDGSQSVAFFAALGGPSGISPPLPVPLKSHLTLPAPACTEEQRTTTPRVVAPEFPGPTPRVALELAGEEPLRLLAKRAVLFGTPSAPCVAAWDASAEAVVPATAREVRALVLPHESGLAGWAFRALPEMSGRREVAALRLRCEVD